MLAELDPLIHSQLRLAIMSILLSVDEADFVYLKEKTESTAGNLSVQLDKLSKAGYIQVEKEFVGKKTRTSCRITETGRKAMEEYVKLWGWSYQDATGKGMKVIGKDNAIKLEGYPLPGKVNINQLDPKALSPSGYELPEKAYYDRIFTSWWMNIHISGGPYSVKSPWNGNRQVFVETGNRDDLVIDGITVPITYHFEVYDKMNGVKDEAVTFYGPGAQWGNGGINHNKILFGSDNGHLWYLPTLFLIFIVYAFLMFFERKCIGEQAAYYCNFFAGTLFGLV